MIRTKDALADAIVADPALCVSRRDAEELAECVRRVALRQPVMTDQEGKCRGQHWPTKAFGLAMQIGYLEEQLRDHR